MLGDPLLKLLPTAIAAFHRLNTRVGQLGMEQKVYPAVVMVGATPSFYKIPITQALVDALMAGQYPPSTTVVQRLVPPVPDLMSYQKDGMRSLDNRSVALCCFEGMKRLMVMAFPLGIYIRLLMHLVVQ